MAALRCFVIGPMSGDHMVTLNWLAHQVIKPLLPKGFVVQTPDLQQTGDIMSQVIGEVAPVHLTGAATGQHWSSPM